ncbi:MAG: prolyl oligopeptidase family serine peptidase, partial [Rubripirellula sp.]
MTIDAEDSPKSRLIGSSIQEHVAKTRRANPISYVSVSDPPVLIMHGDADKVVPFNQSELLHDALTQAGVPSQLYNVIEGGHGFRGAQETREELTKRSIDFFDKTLGA